MKLWRCSLATALTLILSACVNQTIKSSSVPPLTPPSNTVAESRLLDVGINIFDPGLENYDEGQQVYPEVRKAEARFMPHILSDAMQNSGAWGAVRVVPDQNRISDLTVKGAILHSDGERLELQIIATDSRGQQWLDKKYTGRAGRYAYSTTTRVQYDPFQAVYHTIANDLLKRLETLELTERDDIRLVTELLFARSFSEDAFAGFLATNAKGKTTIERLPAKNDPMLERIHGIRERDQLFIDTLQEYYANFSSDMTGPYQEWRKLSYEEAVALQELKAESTRRLIAGGVAILAGIAAATSNNDGSNGSATRAAGNVAIIGGGYLLKSGLEKRNEAQIHVQALEELGMSLEAEIKPQIIELEDRTVLLSGNVEDQYEQWRELLGDIYRAEVGMLEPLENNEFTATAGDTP